MNGNYIIISQGSTAIAGTKSQEITTGCDTIEISSPSSGAWKQFVAGRKEWSVTVKFLLVTAGEIDRCLSVGNIYTLTIKDRDNIKSISGTAIMTQCEESFTRGNLSVGTYSFKGTSALTSNT